MLPLIIQGFGFGLIFVPLSTIGFSTLSAMARKEAAGMFSLLRTIGSSVGISVIVTIYASHAQISWNQLSGWINPFNPAVSNYLNTANLTLKDPLAPQLLASQVLQQSSMIAFLDAFYLIAWSFVVMIPLVFLLKKPKKIIVPTIAD